MRKRKTDSVDLPTTEQIEGELVRLRYKSRYSRTLRSTIAILIVVAAADIRQLHVAHPGGRSDRHQREERQV